MACKGGGGAGVVGVRGCRLCSWQGFMVKGPMEGGRGKKKGRMKKGMARYR